MSLRSSRRDFCCATVLPAAGWSIGMATPGHTGTVLADCTVTVAATSLDFSGTPRARLSACILCAVCAVGGNQLHGASRGLPQDCGPCGRRACCAAWCCCGGCGRQRRGGVDQSWARPLGLGSAMPRSSLLDPTEAAVTAGGVLCTQVTLARRREPWRVDLCAGVSVQPSVSLHVSWGCGRLPRAKATTGPARSRGLGNTVGGLTSQTACVRLYKAQARLTGQERQPWKF